MEKDDLIGASVLVELTIVSFEGEERSEAYFGSIKGFERDAERFQSLDGDEPAEIMIIECHDGQVREFPYDGDSLDVPDPGEYELPDGARMDSPDYFMSWRMTEPAKH